MQNRANQSCTASAPQPNPTKNMRQFWQNLSGGAQSRWQQLYSLWEHRRQRRHLLTLLILGSTALTISATACISYLASAIFLCAD
jgi:hypothetical protein